MSNISMHVYDTYNYFLNFNYCHLANKNFVHKKKKTKDKK